MHVFLCSPTRSPNDTHEHMKNLVLVFNEKCRPNINSVIFCKHLYYDAASVRLDGWGTESVCLGGVNSPAEMCLISVFIRVRSSTSGFSLFLETCRPAAADHTLAQQITKVKTVNWTSTDDEVQFVQI